MKIPQRNTYKIIILITFVLIVLFALKIPSLKFDYNFEAFFPNEDNELEIYETHRNRFEWDNEFVLLGIENNKGIFNKEFLEKIDDLTNELKGLNYIDRVLSPTNLKTISYDGLMPVEKKLLHVSNPDLYKDDSTIIYKSKELVGSFFPRDGKSLSIFIKTDEGLSKAKSDSLAKSIEQTFSKYDFEEVHFVGRIVAQDVYLKNLQSEFVYFLTISFALVIVFLWMSFRSVEGIIYPLIIVLTSIYFTLGVMAYLNKSLDIMTVMLPTMIFITGMSDVVHFFSKYIEEHEKGIGKTEIFKLVIKEVGFPTFLTLITTAIGFLSLLFSSITPIRNFGFYTTVGIIIAFILTYTLLPALLFLFNTKKNKPKKVQAKSPDVIMPRLMIWVLRNQKKIGILTVLLLAFFAIGIYKIKVNNILLEDLSDGVKIKQDFAFFDKHYSGVRPIEIAIEITDKNKSVWDYDIVQQLYQIDEFLKKEYKAGFLYSPAMIVKTMHQAINSSDTEFPTEEEYEDVKEQILNNKKNKDIKRIVTTDAKFARISGKMNDIGSLEVNKMNSNFQSFIANNIKSNQIKVQITGAAHLVDLNNDYMVSNMLSGFVFSFLVTALLTFILHRSLRMVFVFLIPNVIPLVFVAGIMGYAGIELKAATSLVFSIAFGIATDDTIHFISRLKIELDQGKKLLYAFKRTFLDTGKPIVLTSFVLIGGFISLTVSDFQSTFYFGFLLCITMIIALAADLFLLPVLLFWIYSKRTKKNM